MRAFVLSLFCFSIVTAQNADDYFPSKIGNSWRYQQFTLDTLQNQIAASKTIVIDSLRGTKNIKGLTASVIVNGKTTPDSVMLNVQGSTILHYAVGYPRITKLLPVNDLGLGFVWNYAAWYPYMKFGASPGVNVPDTLLKIDTIVAFQSTSLPLQIYVSAMRRSDVSITVPAGTYATTPFVVTLSVNTWQIIPPFPGHVVVRLFNLSDTMFVSKNNWLVKEVQPSTFYPLNNAPTYNVAITQLPGFVHALESASITLSVAPGENLPHAFELEQNFPNPFNPETHLRFSIPARPAGGFKLQMVSLVVYDALGREVMTLVNEELPSGLYDVTFNGARLSSGIYFYRLTAGTETRMKKMILLK